MSNVQSVMDQWYLERTEVQEKYSGAVRSFQSAEEPEITKEEAMLRDKLRMHTARRLTASAVFRKMIAIDLENASRAYKDDYTSKEALVRLRD